MITIPLFQWHSRRNVIKAMQQRQTDAASETTEARGENEDGKDVSARVSTTP